jgi:Mg-chelatase subunit ChlD
MTQMITPKKKVTKKTKPQNARIFFILDRSGSMDSIKDETIGGFNSFLESQKAVPGKATLSLVQFDHEYLVVHNNVPLNEVSALDSKTFVPRGMTALYDAVGMTISRFKNDNPKNTKTIVAILTDGQENSSKEYNYTNLQKMIKDVEREHGWEVLFIGANMNAQAVATQMGIKASNAVNFTYDSKGAKDAFTTLNCAASATRGVDMFYADGTSTDGSGLDMSKMYATAAAVPPKP